MKKRILSTVVLLIMGTGLAQAQPGAGYYPPPQWGPPASPWGPAPNYAPYPRYAYPAAQPMYMPAYPPSYSYPPYPSPAPAQQYLPPTTARSAPLPPVTSTPSESPTPSNVAPATFHNDEPLTTSQPSGASPSPADIASGEGMFNPLCDERVPGERFWVTPEFLMWKAKPGPLPLALVTSGNAADPFPAGLGQPGTTVLFGGSGLNFPAAAGFRGTLGMWIDPCSKFGIEVSGFILENTVVNYSAASDGTGNPILGIPHIFNGAQSAFLVSQPGSITVSGNPVAGSVFVSTASQLYGAELNGMYNLFRSHGFQVDVLGGFRYLNLQESISITSNSTSSDAFGNTTATAVGDSFQASNQFYGGQAGIRLNYQYGSLFGTAILKAAIGVNNEATNINGSTTITTNGSALGFAGGYFAQPTNIGRQSMTPFSAVPQFTARIGWELAPGVRLFGGYDFMYWFNVVRPGSQIDPNVNESQTLGGTISGAAVPAKMFNMSNYYVQGLTLGIEFRY